MALEIRPIKAEEVDELNRIVRTDFASPPEFTVKMRPDWTLCAFDNGKLASTYGFWPLIMQLNGVQAPIAGVTMVGTLPVYRRRGYLREITAEHFRMLYDRGEQPVAALFASRAAIYQRYGYAVVSTRNAYAVEPRYLEFSHAMEIKGEFREAGDDDNRLLLDLYHRFSEPRTGYLRRNESFEVASGAPYTVLKSTQPSGVLTRVIYMEAGKPAGYVIYSATRDTGPGNPKVSQLLIINELVWLSPSAYRAIWTYFSNMDLVQDIIWGRVPPDDPLPHLMLEPRRLNISSSDGLMARIVDVEKALPLRPYSAEGTLTFEVIDDFCSWNQGRWKMEVTSTGTKVNRTGDEPQVVIPVSTLAMLMFGQINASEAARMGRLDTSDYGALLLWDKVMRTEYRPFCSDMF